MPTLREIRRAGAAALLLLAACGGPEAGRGHDYTVRGQVVQVPRPNDPASELQIEHEAVDDFVDRSGRVAGMNAMTMGFPLARGVDLAALAPGDVVEFVLHVDWESDRPVEITRLRELPPDTPLELRLSKPQAGGVDPAGAGESQGTEGGDAGGHQH